MATTFYWHDYETFGLNQRLDRPVQFAGLRTDEHFNPIGEPDMWYCRPAFDYLPNPQACLVTGITPQQAHAKGMTEAEFADRIHAVMTEPGTVSIGYNSLRFDDEVTRHLFWRNFYDAYEREWQNDCSRWDLFPFVLAVWALRPEGIEWPMVPGKDEGDAPRHSFKLENLTKANGLSHEHAHDAGSDVHATMALARLLAQKQPKLWQWALANRGKAAVVKALESGKPCVWVDPFAGQAKGFLRVVMPVAVDPKNKNEYIVWDLSHDPSVLEGMTPTEIARRAFGRAADLQEGETRLPLRTLKVNAFPFVCADLRILNARVCERFGMDLQTIVNNGERLTELQSQLESPVILSRDALNEAVRPPADPDAALYDGFIGFEDKRGMQRLHGLTPEQLTEYVREGRLYFDDPRLVTLLKRYRARNWPEQLNAQERAEWTAHCQHRLHTGIEGVLTIEAYFEAIDHLAQENEEAMEEGTLTEETYTQRQNVLDALYDWGEFVAQVADGEGI